MRDQLPDCVRHDEETPNTIRRRCARELENELGTMFGSSVTLGDIARADRSLSTKRSGRLSHRAGT